MTENKKLNEFKRPPIKIVMQSSLKVKRKEDAPIVCATYARVSSVEYINARTKVCVICHIHGEFWVTPSNHLQNRGCRKCGLEKRSAERRKKKKS